MKCITGQRVSAEIYGANSPSVDAFGRLRVSDPVTLFDSQMQYDAQPLLWVEKTAGAGASAHDADSSSVDMTVGTASGDSVIRQTREYFRYQPGKSHLIKMTGVFGSAVANVNKLIGYGDTNNGIFMGQDGSGMYVLLRSSVTGSVSDSRKVYQASWNIDPMDGNGPSNMTLDPTKAQIVLIDIEWLGVGRVRVGLVIGGAIYYVHEFLNANQATTTYMTTANLPCRYEITNTGASAGATLKHICTEVESEGGQQNSAAFPFAASATGVSIPQGSGNAIIIFATRHALTFNGIENRGQFIPIGYEVLATGGRVVSSIVYNPTLTGGTWGAVNASSFMEGNSTVTSFSGGITIDTSLTAGSGNNRTGASSGTDLSSRLPFGLDIDGANPITLALAVYSLDNSTSADFTFRWQELR